MLPVLELRASVDDVETREEDSNSGGTDEGLVEVGAGGVTLTLDLAGGLEGRLGGDE